MSSLPPKIKREEVTIQHMAAPMPLIAFDDDSSMSDSSVKAVNGMDTPHVSAVKLEADTATDMNDAEIDHPTNTSKDMKEEVVATTEEKTTDSEQGKKPKASTIRRDAAATVATAGPIYSLLSSDEDENTDSESADKKEAVRTPQQKKKFTSPWNLFQQEMKGKGMTREQIYVEYQGLSPSEKAKLQSKAEDIRKESESIHLSSGEDENTDSESNAEEGAAKKKVTSPWNLLPWKLFQQEMKGKGMTREQIAAEYHGLNPSEKAKLQAKAEELRKESESMQSTKSVGKANTNNQPNQGGGNVDVAWKCHQCATLNALDSLRCNGLKQSGHRCMAYKGKRSKNTSTSTEGCELVWLENGAKLGLRHDNSDECFICRMGGSLLCCDFCDKSFHLGCHIPPLDSVPFGDFKCCECRAQTLNKLFHCGSCQICLSGEVKQCPNKRYAPPAIVSPAKQKTSDTSSTMSKTNPSTIERTGTANPIVNTADESASSSQTSEDDIPNDLVACQRELKRSQRELKRSLAEIKRLKGALQAMIA